VAPICRFCNAYVARCIVREVDAKKNTTAERNDAATIAGITTVKFRSSVYRRTVQPGVFSFPRPAATPIKADRLDSRYA